MDMVSPASNVAGESVGTDARGIVGTTNVPVREVGPPIPDVPVAAIAAVAVSSKGPSEAWVIHRLTSMIVFDEVPDDQVKDEFTFDPTPVRDTALPSEKNVDPPTSVMRTRPKMRDRLPAT